MLESQDVIPLCQVKRTPKSIQVNANNGNNTGTYNGLTLTPDKLALNTTYP